MERKLKGINFRSMLGAIERLHGVDARRRVVEAIEGEGGEALRHGAVIASGWYPASWYASVLRAVDRVIGGGTATIRALGRDAIEHDLKTILRVVRLFLKPELALEQAMRISRRYVDGGEIEVLEATEGLVHYRFTEYHGYTHLMWWDFIAGIEAVIAMMGATDLRPQILRGGEDGDFLELRLTWREA